MNEPLSKFQLNSSQKNKNNTKATRKQRAPWVANGIQAERAALGYNTWSQIVLWNTVTQTVTYEYKTRIGDQWDRRSCRHLISLISCFLSYVYMGGDMDVAMCRWGQLPKEASGTGGTDRQKHLVPLQKARVCFPALTWHVTAASIQFYGFWQPHTWHVCAYMHASKYIQSLL